MFLNDLVELIFNQSRNTYIKKNTYWVYNDFYFYFLTFWGFFADKECFKNDIDTSTIRNNLPAKPIIVITTSYPVDENEKHNYAYIGEM